LCYRGGPFSFDFDPAFFEGLRKGGIIFKLRIASKSAAGKARCWWGRISTAPRLDKNANAHI
jgi:hypothetical protein